MSTLLHECLTLSESGRAVRVDREAGTIGPVKVLGYKSANGREYLPAGVDAALYEGRRVNAGHARGGGERDPRDTYAVLEGVGKTEHGLYAQRLRLLHPKGEFEQRLLGAAEHAPHLFGLSHTARGTERPGSGGKIIESVESVESVDLVTDPATVSGFFESRNPPMRKKVRDLIESLKATRPKYSRCLKEMAEAGIMSPDAEMDAPADAAGDVDHEQAILDAAAAVLRDPDLPVADKMKKIKTLLGMTEGGKGAEKADEPPATEESRRLKAENGQLLAEKLIRKAAGTAGVPLTERQVELAARPGMTEAQAAETIKDLWGAGGGGSQKPRSAGPVPLAAGANGAVRESKDGAGEIPDDPKARAAWLARED